MTTTIVFDLDGTLLDTLADLAGATNHALRSFRMPERTIGEVRMMVGNGVAKLIERAVPAGTPPELTAQVLDSFRAYYVGHCMELTRLYPGIEPMLRELGRRGYKLAIVSNKLQAGVDELWSHYFRSTIHVAVGEREAEGIRRKPAPDMVELALRQLGAAKSEAVYVGDSDVDIATARAAGLPCISVLWGFRDRPLLEAHGATTFAATPEDIVRIVGGA